MYTNPLLELNVSWIPVLEWSIVQDEKEAQSVRDGWGISDEWTILATDILGDTIVVKDDILFSINHEDLEALKLAPSLTALLSPLADLCKVGEYSEETPYQELRSKKDYLMDLRKMFKGILRDHIEAEIEEMKELISDKKFYETKKGKLWLEMNKFSKEYEAAIGKPVRYSRVNLITDPERLKFVVSGYMVTSDETISELKRIADSMPRSFPIYYEKLFADQLEYTQYLRKLQADHEIRLQQKKGK